MSYILSPMSPGAGDTQKVDLDCPFVHKTIGMIQKYCEIFDTQGEGQKLEWVNDICLNRYECEKKGVMCRYSSKNYPGLPNPFKDLEI